MPFLVSHEVIPIPVLLAIFGVSSLVIVAGLASGRVVNKKKFVLEVLLVEYLLIVICATLVCRHPLRERYLHLWYFSGYADILNGRYTDTVRDTIVNLLIFLPVGVLLAGIDPSIKWYKVLLFGFACSLSIEVLQFVFIRGVAQGNDLLHNTVSCLAGWLLAKGVVGIS